MTIKIFSSFSTITVILIIVIGVLVEDLTYAQQNRYNAAVMHPNKKAYFFAKDKYYRFDFQSDKVDQVETIGVTEWTGLPAGIDAAILHPNGKAYFFIGNKYYRFDFKIGKVDKLGTIGKSGWTGL